MKSNKQGSGLLLVLIIMTTLGIGAYSVLNLVNAEFRLNKKAAVYNEAKQAAETLIQASLADLQDRFDNQTAFAVDALSPSKDPLYISSEFVSVYKNDPHSFLKIPSRTKYTSADQFNTQDTEIIGGQVPPGEWFYIDPNEPGNDQDDMAGTRVFQRNIEIISKATVDRPNVGTATAYARQYLQVRDAPLFAYAIFYNLPLEIAPGPRMDIYGNVHANDSAWFQSGGGLNFHARVTIAGKLFHGRHEDYGKNTSYADVEIINAEDKLVNMKRNNSDWPTDSYNAYEYDWLVSPVGDVNNNFTNVALQIWDGNLQTGEHGVQPQNPVGVSNYIEDVDNNKTNGKQSLNTGYQIIQPVLNASQLALPDESADPVAYKRAKALNEVEKQKYAYKAGLTIKVSPNGDLSYIAYNRNSDGELQYNTAGNPRRRILSPPANTIAKPKMFNETPDGVLVSGIHDKRQAQDLDIIELDVEKLKDFIHANNEADWGGDANKKPEEWWNGIVYVEFPTQNTSSSRDDNVNPAVSGWGLKVVNGETIPNPDFAREKNNFGTSIATNQMMYVEGNFNADGNTSDSNSPTTPDKPSLFAEQDEEAPAALVADSITFLSENWNDSNSIQSLSTRKATDTEVSAAILTGLVPSGDAGRQSYSGGVENFPRFLEDWGGKKIVIRGSIVALFDSEVGTRGWGSGDTYSAPNRAWGFHKSFAEGFLPPGTPNTRKYKTMDFKFIDEAEYNADAERIKGYF